MTNYTASLFEYQYDAGTWNFQAPCEKSIRTALGLPRHRAHRNNVGCSDEDHVGDEPRMVGKVSHPLHDVVITVCAILRSLEHWTRSFRDESLSRQPATAHKKGVDFEYCLLDESIGAILEHAERMVRPFEYDQLARTIQFDHSFMECT